MYKKTNKKNLVRITAGFAILLALGCSNEFLQDKKTDGLNDITAFSSDATATAVVSGIYDALQAESDGREYNTKSLWVPSNYPTLDFEDSGADTQFSTFTVKSDDGRWKNLWVLNYQGIGRANAAIAKLKPAIEAGKVTKALGNRLLGESLFLRGFLYTSMAQNFGGLPIVTEETTDYTLGRNTQDEVFTQIVKDMEAAIPLLVWTYDSDNKGRATKAAAYHYLGNAYMWLKQYDKAAAAFEALQGHAELEANYVNIHAAANRNGKESLFEIQLSSAASDMGWGRNDNVTYLQSMCMPQELSGWGGYINATKVLYDSFEAGDKRKLCTVLGPGDAHPDPLMQIKDHPEVKKAVVGDKLYGLNTCGTLAKPWLQQSNAGYFCVKTWRDPQLQGNSYGTIFGGQNQILARYGESLLSLAECYLQLGQGAKAATTLNIIRTRAGLASKATITITDILDEYRHELAGEFTQWFLYRRSGKATQYMLLRTGKTVPAGRELMPLPKSQLDANPNLVQNPTY
ncbi:RagB/SusD family nutrient uptake outer membrane protein [Flavobacterium restrictum]|uniref:RagB/SusD family nutrient uptake outer membrane protein n=1 Tax=Flavobacterium restrictum TaxID=2594428 RepID=A0A553EBF6_9FLAO|nr:RagB/SusD family nutrient uptake outer membrane protein [Flavobacterium restrictum]TRX42397.1 RagB/SusD family nutrient uptake outer membrane protein [Flavobacterium restrictum]